jgi:hypothetical protein
VPAQCRAGLLLPWVSTAHRRAGRVEVRVSPKTDPALLLDLAERLLDSQADGHTLTAAEEAFLRNYGQHVYSGPTRPPRPTTVAPGPAKVEVLRLRVELGLALWHPDDLPLAVAEEEEYDPIHAAGNFATVGRILRPLGEHP